MVEDLHELPARLTGARRARAERALRAVPEPVLIAGGAPAARRARGRLPTVGTGSAGRGELRRGGRALEVVPAPVHLAHPTAPVGEVVPGGEAAPTDAAGACRHAPTPSDDPNRPGQPRWR